MVRPWDEFHGPSIFFCYGPWLWCKMGRSCLKPWTGLIIFPSDLASLDDVMGIFCRYYCRGGHTTRRGGTYTVTVCEFVSASHRAV